MCRRCNSVSMQQIGGGAQVETHMALGDFGRDQRGRKSGSIAAAACHPLAEGQVERIDDAGILQRKQGFYGRTTTKI